MVLSNNYCCGACLIFFRRLYICSVLRHNHYKTLGLSPSATQAQIKSAYYELSKKHHPDRNQGSEKSAKMFRDITAAYEILGNEKLRKKYDNNHSLGNFNDESANFDTSSRGYNDDIERMYYERRNRQFDKRYYYGKTAYYNFDAWYKAHYGRNPYFDNDDWLRGSYKKNSHNEFEEWHRNHYERTRYRFHSGPYRSYKQSTEAMKRREYFFFKTEKAFLLIFYITIIGALFIKM